MHEATHLVLRALARGGVEIPDAVRDEIAAVLAPCGTRRGIYVASRATVPGRVEMWRRLRAEGHEIVSSWIDAEDVSAAADWSELWTRIAAEVARAALLVLYVEPEDFPLKGAFVEVGMALSAGTPIRVYAPGVTIEPRSLRPLGSWLGHPLVSVCSSIEEALAA